MIVNISITLKDFKIFQDISKEEILDILKTKFDKSKKKKLKKEVSRKKKETIKQKLVVQYSQKLKEKAEEFRERLIEQQTLAEKTLKILLKELDIKYEFQKIVYLTNKFYILDFYLPDCNSAIELDGFHHFTKEGAKRDVKRTKDLKEFGISKVLRFANGEVLDTTEEKLKREKMLNLIILTNKKKY